MGHDTAIDALFTPDTIAVIGASRDGDKIGHSVMRNIVENRFAGQIIPVNPNADEVLGREAYNSVKDIPADVDLAVIAVPAGIANEAVTDCIAANVSSVIIISSGYKEIGETGKNRSDELQELLNGTDTRVLGPNCLGVWDAYSGVDTLFLPSYKLQRPPKGDIAIISQSGAFGSTLMDMLAEMEVGISRFISYGNQADITDIELLEWLQDDDETAAVAVYMEGVSDGEQFIETAKQVTPEMPIITLKAGKHDAGKQAVSSHTGSLAGSYDVYNGVFKQTGVIEATTVNKLYDYTRALAHNPVLDGKQIAVVTNGGGFGVLTADAIVQTGLEMADFSAETREALADVMPDHGTVGNPLDLIGDADAERYEEALGVLQSADEVDGVIVIPLLQPLPLNSAVVDTIINFREDYDKPVVACMTGSQFTELHMKNLERNNVPAYAAPTRAAGAMHALYRYGEWQRRQD